MLLTPRYTANSPQPPGARIVHSDPINDRLAGHWLLNESGGLTAYDISFNDRHGTLVNGPASSPGARGYALSFDGTDDRVTLPVINLLSVGTVCFWVKVNGNGTPDAGNVVDLVSNISADAHYGWSIGYHTTDNKIDFYIGRNSATLFGTEDKSITVLTRGLWYFVACSYDNATKRIYLNGAQDATAATVVDGTNTANGWAMAARGGTAARFANIELQNVRIYTRVLHPREINTLYERPYTGVSFQGAGRALWAPEGTGAAPAAINGNFLAFF